MRKKILAFFSAFIIAVELAVIAWSIYDMRVNGNIIYPYLCIALGIPVMALTMVYDSEGKVRSAKAWMCFHALVLLISGIWAGLAIQFSARFAVSHWLLDLGPSLFMLLLSWVSMYLGLKKLLEEIFSL